MHARVLRALAPSRSLAHGCCSLVRISQSKSNCAVCMCCACELILHAIVWVDSQLLHTRVFNTKKHKKRICACTRQTCAYTNCTHTQNSNTSIHTHNKTTNDSRTCTQHNLTYSEKSASVSSTCAQEICLFANRSSYSAISELWPEFLHTSSILIFKLWSCFVRVIKNTLNKKHSNWWKKKQETRTIFE